MQNASQTCQKKNWRHLNVSMFYMRFHVQSSLVKRNIMNSHASFEIIASTDISTLHQSVRPSIWKKWCCLYRSTPLPWLTVTKVFWLQVAPRNKFKLFHGGTTQLLLFPCHGYNTYSLPQFSQLEEIWCVAIADLHSFNISPFLDWFILEIMSKEFTSTTCQAIRDKTRKKNNMRPSM
jgi:hypothetical protein